MLLYQIEKQQAALQAAVQNKKSKRVVITESALRTLLASWKKKEKRTVFKVLSTSAPKAMHKRLDAFVKKEKKLKKEVLLTAIDLGLRVMEQAESDKSTDDTRPIKKSLSSAKPSKVHKTEVNGGTEELQRLLTSKYPKTARIFVMEKNDELVIRYAKDVITDTSAFPKRHGNLYVRRQPYSSSELARLST